MKTITIMLTAFTLAVSAQTPRPGPPIQPKSIGQISREVESPRWICSDKHIFDDVKVLEINGDWVKIDYAVFVPRPPVVVDANAEVKRAGTAQLPRRQTWVNTLHVIRIESGAQPAPDSGLAPRKE
jgi:hypothetical protein